MNKQNYKDAAPTYAWIGRKTLQRRNHWQQLSEIEFIFDKNGIRITIPDEARANSGWACKNDLIKKNPCIGIKLPS